MKGSGPGSLGGLILFFIGELLFGKKKRTRLSNFQTTEPSKQKRNDNCSRMKDIAERFNDHTAEVIPFWVIGNNRVQKFRQVNIGERVDLRIINGDMQVFFNNEFIANLYPASGSRLERLIRDGIRFNAYLGGRDLSYSFDTDIDSCSLIVFYQLPGVAPTKVIIKDT